MLTLLVDIYFVFLDPRTGLEILVRYRQLDLESSNDWPIQRHWQLLLEHLGVVHDLGGPVPIVPRR